MLIIFYNGFSTPQEIDIEEITINNNYLGEITEDLREEWEYIKNNYTLEDMEENQPLQASFDIWINPTLQQLINFNRSVLLDDMDYIGEFKVN